MKLKNANVIVTGASSGIGLELVKRLLKEDCNIIAVARNVKKIEFESPKLIKHSADLSNKKNIDKLYEFAKEKFGNIDLYISNAGFAYYEIIEKADWEHMQKIFNLNVFANLYAVEKLKDIKKDDPFNFVITASAMGMLPLPGYTLYSSTKHAVVGFAGAYRYELGKGQKLQVVLPIGTKTNFFKEAGGSPLPFPTQSVEVVAKRIIRGIKWNIKNIFPSKLFLFMYYLNKLFPFVLKLEQYIEYIKLKNWLKKNDMGHLIKK